MYLFPAHFESEEVIVYCRMQRNIFNTENNILNLIPRRLSKTVKKKKNGICILLYGGDSKDFHSNCSNSNYTYIIYI